MNRQARTVKSRTYTALMKQEDGWWVGMIAEVPGAISEGRTQAELVRNLKGAMDDLFAVYREQARKAMGRRFIRQAIPA